MYCEILLKLHTQTLTHLPQPNTTYIPVEHSNCGRWFLQYCVLREKTLKMCSEVAYLRHRIIELDESSLCTFPCIHAKEIGRKEYGSRRAQVYVNIPRESCCTGCTAAMLLQNVCACALKETLCALRTL